MSQPYSGVVYSEREAINAVWVMVSAAMIFFMQCGFALLQCGSLRQKNSTYILIENLFNACVGCLGFWLIGYAFAFGDVKDFIGGSPDFFASAGFEKIPEDHYLLWVFHWAFACFAANIVSGSIAERSQLTTYLAFSFIMTSFIYPVVIAWTWGGGWLQQLGFHDFAGTATINIVGGGAGLCGAIVLGERYGKDKDRKAKQEHREHQHDEPRERQNSVALETSNQFQKVMNHVNKDYHEAFKEWLQSQTEEFRPHNQTYIVTGALILTVGWLFFCGGKTLGLFVPRANAPAKIIMNTIIAGCFGGVLAVFVKPHIVGTYSFVSRYDCVALCGGFLTGLVSVSGTCDQIEPWAGVIIGCIGAMMYILGCKLLEIFHIDDPCEGAAIHLMGGIWGTIATGFFNNQHGLFYGSDDKWAFFGYQFVGVLAVLAWVVATSLPIFLFIKKLGYFRIDKSIEIIGLDIAEMGGISEELYEKLRSDLPSSSVNLSKTENINYSQSHVLGSIRATSDFDKSQIK